MSNESQDRSPKSNRTDFISRIDACIRYFESVPGAMTGWRGHLLRAACLVVPFVIFTVAAFGGEHLGVARAVRFNDPAILLLLIFCFYLVYRLRGWLGVFAGLCATLLLFALDLAGVWLTPQSGAPQIIGGLLPWSDASDYLWGAQLLNVGGELDAVHGRRPWFVGLLAVLLGVTGGNLQWAIAILVAITAVACFFLARAVQKSHGSAAAVMLLIVLWIFDSRFIGMLATEHLGLALGASGLAALWLGSQQSRLGLSWFTGLFLLTCALITRAGAFFVLPALLVWGTLHTYYAGSPRESLKVLVIGGAAVGAGFVLDVVLRQALVPHAVPFGNFSHTLYGLVVGNKGWTRVLYDHPELLNMDAAAADKQIFRLALEAFLANPQSAMSGVLGAWHHYFTQGYGLFSFVPGRDPRWVVIFLTTLGLVSCLRHWRIAPYSMVLAMAAGILLSVPFVPPVDAHFMRVYAATIPLNAVLVSLGTAFVLSARGSSSLPRQPLAVGMATSYGGSLVLVTFAGSIIMRLLGSSAAYAQLPCPAGLFSLYVRIEAGAAIHIVEDDARTRSKVPEIRVSDYRKGLWAERINYRAVYPELKKLQAGQELRVTTNLGKDRYGERLWLISDSDATPDKGLVHVCAEVVSSAGHNIYHTREIRIAPED